MEKHEIRNLRNHPTYIVETSWGAIVVLVMMVVNGLQNVRDLIDNIDVKDSSNVMALLGIIGCFLLYCGVMVFFSFRHWKRTVLTIVDGTMTWEQRTLFAKKQEIAISTISNVNLEQNLFERIVGTYKLKIDTSSLSTADKTDMKIILSEAKAQEVRNLILSMMAGATESEDIPTESEQESNPYTYTYDQDPFDIELSPMENVKCAIASIDEKMLSMVFSMFFFAVIILVIMVAVGLSFQESIVSILAVLLAALGFMKKVVSKFLDCYNYKVRRKGDHVYISSGAIKTRAYSVPVNKIQALRLNKSLLGRLMHRTEVSVVNVGGENEDVNGQLLLPAVLDRELPGMLAKILPEYEITSGENLIARPVQVWIRKWIVGILYILFVWGIGYVLYREYALDALYQEGMGILAKALNVVIPVWIVLLIVWKSIESRMEHVTEGIQIQEQGVTIRRGGISYEQIQIAYDKIQMMELNQGPVKRLCHTKKGVVHMLASSLAQEQKIPEFHVDVMEELKRQYQRTQCPLGTL